MHLVSYRCPPGADAPALTGLLLRDGGIAPLEVLWPASPPAPRSIVELLEPAAWETLRGIAERRAADRGLAHRLVPPGRHELLAPLRPGKLITVARNYRAHLEESGVTEIGPVPSASIKASSVVGPPFADIVRPTMERQLDYETELAVVIGRRCRNVPAERAYEVIAGYMVMNDVVARQVLKTERRAGNQFLGKMFDTFAPMGPCLVTADEVSDPMNLAISTRVNGELRQQGNTRDMIWSIPRLVAYFSQTTLEPGDVISTGTPAGVAAGRKAGQTPWFLQPGDVIESEIEGIGLLRNRVVEEPEQARHWAWN